MLSLMMLTRVFEDNLECRVGSQKSRFSCLYMKYEQCGLLNHLIIDIPASRASFVFRRGRYSKKTCSGDKMMEISIVYLLKKA